MSTYFSQCATDDRNNSSSAAADGGGVGEFMLFGVRIKLDPMRKTVSLNNLSQYESINNGDAVDVAAAAAAYASADEAVVRRQSSGSRERNRGIPWTEEEHKLFLLGLQKVGKGDWRGISRRFVKTRTSTQVASHAQKYFLRQSNIHRRRRRSSLFDITTDLVTPAPMEEEESQPPNLQPPAETTPVLSPLHIDIPKETLTLGDQANNAYESNRSIERLALSLGLSLSSPLQVI